MDMFSSEEFAKKLGVEPEKMTKTAIGENTYYHDAAHHHKAGTFQQVLKRFLFPVSSGEGSEGLGLPASMLIRQNEICRLNTKRYMPEGKLSPSRNQPL